MMPDLGKYAVVVLSSYGVTLFLIMALVVISLRRSHITKHELKELQEQARGKNDV